MMAETAHHISGVAVVVGMAAEWGSNAELLAFFGGANILVHGIHGLQNTTRELLEFAELRRLIHAVILQIIETLRDLEGA